MKTSRSLQRACIIFWAVGHDGSWQFGSRKDTCESLRVCECVLNSPLLCTWYMQFSCCSSANAWCLQTLKFILYIYLYLPPFSFNEEHIFLKSNFKCSEYVMMRGKFCELAVLLLWLEILWIQIEIYIERKEAILIGWIILPCTHATHLIKCF